MERIRKIGLSIKRKNNINRLQDDSDASAQNFRAAVGEKMVIMTTQMRKSQQREQNYKKNQLKF